MGVAAVVVTVAVTVRAVVVGVKLAGLNEQPTPAGSGGAQDIVTAPGDVVVVERTLSVNVVDAPTETIRVGVEVVMVKVGVVVETVSVALGAFLTMPPCAVPVTEIVFAPVEIEVVVRTVRVEVGD